MFEYICGGGIKTEMFFLCWMFRSGMSGLGLGGVKVVVVVMERIEGLGGGKRYS